MKFGPRALLLWALLATGGCSEPTALQHPNAAERGPTAILLFDTARKRSIPVALYGAEAGRPKPLAVISHGYGGKNIDYGFIANALSARGYVVAAIQQDLPGDAPPASEGNLRVLRRPIWHRGADSIVYVARELRARGLADPSRLVLVGHSNGGDTVMLLAAEHPELVRIAISLDNRRMPLPRTKRPRICSLRSSDLPPDPGVLPEPEEQRALAMLIVKVPVEHNDMWDAATETQKKTMLAVIAACLDGHPAR